MKLSSAFEQANRVRRPGAELAAAALAGFSMIEALAVIAVIAILATLALPSYLDKIIRDQVVEALPLADIAKAPIAAAWATSQPLPADNAAADLPAPDKIVNYVVSAVAVRSGAIDITLAIARTASSRARFSRSARRWSTTRPSCR